MLSNEALRDFRNFIKRQIYKGQYRVGSTWYDANLVEIQITNDGTVRVKSEIAHGAPCTITGVRLISQLNEVWATKTVNVVIERATTNLMQWFDFTIKESEVS